MRSHRPSRLARRARSFPWLPPPPCRCPRRWRAKSSRRVSRPARACPAACRGAIRRERPLLVAPRLPRRYGGRSSRNPWSIAFPAGGEMLRTERPGRLPHLCADGKVVARAGRGRCRKVWRRTVARGGLRGGGGGGGEVVPHPDFARKSAEIYTLSLPKGSPDDSTATNCDRGAGGSRTTRLVDVQEIFVSMTPSHSRNAPSLSGRMVVRLQGRLSLPHRRRTGSSRRRWSRSIRPRT
jgi:hypothetical protein